MNTYIILEDTVDGISTNQVSAADVREAVDMAVKIFGLGDKLPEVLTGNKPEPQALPAPQGDRLKALAEAVDGLSESEKEELQKMLNKART